MLESKDCVSVEALLAASKDRKVDWIFHARSGFLVSSWSTYAFRDNGDGGTFHSIVLEYLA